MGDSPDAGMAVLLDDAAAGVAAARRPAKQFTYLAYAAAAFFAVG